MQEQQQEPRKPRCKNCKGETTMVLAQYGNRLVYEWECLSCGKTMKLHEIKKKRNKKYGYQQKRKAPPIRRHRTG